jgi:hypothetical protein
MDLLKKLWQALFSQERRKGARKPAPGLAAFYWTGAAPKEHGIRDISPAGMYLVTEERWYPGTLIMMTLQEQAAPGGGAGRSIAVQSKAVRWGEDGVGLEFLLPDYHDPRRGQGLLKDGTDRKGLEKFLENFRIQGATAVVNYVRAPEVSSAVSPQSAS